MFEPLSSFGNSKVSSNTNTSRSVSLSILDSNSQQISMHTDGNETIEFRIPRDPSLFISSMTRENVTSISIINQTSLLFPPHQLLFYLHYVNLTTSLSSLPVSLHLRMRSLNATLAYLFIYKFDQSPQLNSSIQLIDGWTLFCPPPSSPQRSNTHPLSFSLSKTKTRCVLRCDEWKCRLRVFLRQWTNIRSSIVDLWSPRTEWHWTWSLLSQHCSRPTTDDRWRRISFHCWLWTSSFHFGLLLSRRQSTVESRWTSGSIIVTVYMGSRRGVDLCLGRTVDEWTRDTMFFQTFDDLCRWLCCSSKTDQLELCLCQCRFPEEQNDVFDDHRCFSSLSALVDLRPSSRQERSSQSDFILLRWNDRDLSFDLVGCDTIARQPFFWSLFLSDSRLHGSPSECGNWIESSLDSVGWWWSNIGENLVRCPPKDSSTWIDRCLCHVCAKVILMQKRGKNIISLVQLDLWVFWISFVFGTTTPVKANQPLGFSNTSSCKICRRCRSFISSPNNGSPSKKGMDWSVSSFSLSICSSFFDDRSNVFFPLPVPWRNISSLMSCRRRPITAFQMVICGFRSFLDLHRIDSLVFNVALRVLFFSSFRCSWTSCITISRNKRRQRKQQNLVEYSSVLFTSLHNRFVPFEKKETNIWFRCVVRSALV